MQVLSNLLFVSIILILKVLVSCNDVENSLSIVKQNDDNNQEENDVSIDDNVDEDNENDVHSSEPFVPSNEWQTIKKGQVIPAGLHVRLNLETGLREAKIMDPNNDEIDVNHKYIDKHKKVIETQSKSSLKSNAIRDQIKEVLKNLKFSQELDTNQLKDSEKSSSDFRSMDEIKKEFDDMNIKIHSESELLANLIEKYKKSSIVEKLSLLYDIEYLVHSIDVAQDLVKLDGINLLLPDLNSTNSYLRAQIAFTIGSAMNANPKVQVEVLKNGALHKLLLLLRYDSSINVKKKALFAISSLVRQFPSAQKALIQEYGGLSIFANLFKNTNMNSINLSAKVITLLNDLLIEHQLTAKYATNDQFSQIKLQQYQEIELNRALIEEGFCDLVPQLLNSPDNDVREKTIEAMNSFLFLCKKEFKNSLEVLKQISLHFNELSKSETEGDASDAYFTNLYHLTNDLINKLNSELRDEL